MIDTLYVVDGQENKKVSNVIQFEEHEDGVFVEFADGTSAEFDSVWAGYSGQEKTDE